jgi:hypothetical protein
MRLPREGRVLARAKARLDRLRLYPEPVDVSRVSIHVVPGLFRVPGFRRFRGYATFRRILLKRAVLDEDLIVHELCHIWQAQQRPIRMWLSYARPSTFSRDRAAYRANRYEREAREAVQRTRGGFPGSPLGEPETDVVARFISRSPRGARGARTDPARPADAGFARRSGEPRPARAGAAPGRAGCARALYSQPARPGLAGSARSGFQGPRDAGFAAEPRAGDPGRAALSEEGPC